MDDDEYSKLQLALVRRPDWGNVIPGSGGIRKLRWAGSGRGKRDLLLADSRPSNLAAGGVSEKR